MEYKQADEWDTYRSDCGQARLTFHSEWSKSIPWVSYINGTAGRHFETLRQGIAALEARGYRFSQLRKS